MHSRKKKLQITKHSLNALDKGQLDPPKPNAIIQS